MKTIILLIISSFTALAVMAQQTATVTIIVKGERNKEVLVDGQSYTVNTDVSSPTPVNAPITISNLSTGQHTLVIRRTDRYGTISSTGNTTSFNLRSGYNLEITVNSNGSVQQKETRMRRNANYSGTYRVPMTDENFDQLIMNIEDQRTQSAKAVAISNAFNNTANYFTTQQARELIALVNSQSRRLNLAKAAYKTITDPGNFSQIDALLTSQSNRRELADYISEYDAQYNTNNNTNYHVPMSATAFNNLYLAARQQYSNTDKINYIGNVFANNTNYFTTTQEKQLILLVTTEPDRLTLAKAGWDNLTDPQNHAQLYDMFSTNMFYRNEFIAFATSNGSNSGPGPVRVAMTDANFNSLYNSISNTWGLGAKMTSLTNAFNSTSNFFTTAQVRQLIPLVSSETNRLQLGKLAFDNVVDPANYSQLYDVLSSQASRNELDAYVKANSTSTGYVPYTPVRVPMSGESFNTIYNTISNQWGLGAKYSSLTDVFANSNNLFTTAQSRQLIQLVSSESNRLQLAKSAFDNIVDPENFSQLYDIFTSQASRNELAAYVNSYSYNR